MRVPLCTSFVHNRAHRAVPIILISTLQSFSSDAACCRGGENLHVHVHARQLHVLLFYCALSRGTQYYDVRVSLTVSVRLRVHISGSTCPTFTECFCMLSIVVALSFSSGDAIRNAIPVLWMTLFEQNGQEEARRKCVHFKRAARVWHRGVYIIIVIIIEGIYIAQVRKGHKCRQRWQYGYVTVYVCIAILAIYSVSQKNKTPNSCT